MATQPPQSLARYLQVPLPRVPSRPSPNPTGNTKNTAYDWTDIRDITRWNEFDMTHINQQYGQLLANTTIAADPSPTSPRQTIRSENGLGARIVELVMPRVRRAMRAAFNAQANGNAMAQRTELSIDVGEASRTIENFLPDVAYYVVNARFATRPNCAPGDVKLHWKWRSGLANGGFSEQWEYRQGLSQLNYYMRRCGSRYGFSLTDHELIAIRRLDDNGNLEVSDPIPWEAGGNVAQPTLTVLLALWYLGMLAANDGGADAWNRF